MVISAAFFRDLHKGPPRAALTPTGSTRMTTKPIAIASDHAGYELKSALIEEIRSSGREVLDLGTDSIASVDYPDFADTLAGVILEGRADQGVLVCGTGIGIAIAANRHLGIRAATCHDETTARLARAHNDANVLALGARIVGLEVAKDCLRGFLGTGFAAGRHQRRVDKLAHLNTAIEAKEPDR